MSVVSDATESRFARTRLADRLLRVRLVEREWKIVGRKAIDRTETSPQTNSRRVECALQRGTKWNRQGYRQVSQRCGSRRCGGKAAGFALPRWNAGYVLAEIQTEQGTRVRDRRLQAGCWNVSVHPGRLLRRQRPDLCRQGAPGP